ncbi:hypothetical protein K501DRAFT_198446 [Backusella circina FSU 941]|nr:hypothetical protein K501DRAFT_198446 [Backusella circina FSU 941]
MLADPIESTKYERRLAREKEIKSTVNQKKLAMNQILSLTLSLVINLALPLILYYTLRNRIGAVYALLISGIPPLLNVIYKFIRRRKLDGFGILFVVAFVVSGVVSLITGDARVAVLRESIITGVIGVVFLFTMIPFSIGKFTNRPVLFLILREFYSEYPPISWIDRDGNRQEQESVKWLFDHHKPFKTYIYVNTTFNGVVLLCECAVRLILVLATSLSIDDIVKYGTIMIAIASSLLAVVSTIHYTMISKGIANFYHDWMDENDFSHTIER